MRIDKLFSNLGILSRSECKKAVKAGNIKVNGAAVKSPDEQVDPDRDQVMFKGALIDCSEFVYYILNKPAGVVTARDDKLNKTVFSYIHDSRPDLSPVGRLDKDTTGLLIITNDGNLNHRLLSAKYHVPKTYIAEIEGELTPENIKLLEEGVDIGDDTPTLPAQVSVTLPAESGFRFDDEANAANQLVALTIHEGRYHQVKRMFQAVGHPVLKLHRYSFGPLLLPENLEPGKIHRLSAEEIALLKNAGEAD